MNSQMPSHLRKFFILFTIFFRSNPLVLPTRISIIQTPYRPGFDLKNVDSYTSLMSSNKSETCLTFENWVAGKSYWAEYLFVLA